VNQSLIKLIGPYFYLACLLLAVAATRRFSENRWAGLLAALLLGTTPALVAGEGSAASGYADFPLAAVSLCAIIHCARYWKTGSVDAIHLTGATALFLPFMKSEGSIAFIFIALAVVPKVVRDRNWKVGLGMLGPGAAMWFGWAAFLRLTHSFPEYDLRPATITYFRAGVHRVPALLYAALEELVAWNRWSLLWPLSIAAIILMARSRPFAEWYPWAVNVLAPLAFFPMTYILSGWEPATIHLQSSLWRLWLHTAPAGAVVTAAVMVRLLTISFASLDETIIGVHRDGSKHACG
jgi:hypothetical protein